MNVFCYLCTNRKIQREVFMPATLQQLRLGASSGGELILVRPPSDSVQNLSTDGPSLHITNMPDEILNEIFSFAITSDHWYLAYDKCALSLSRVCKLFYRITQPLLFRNIQFPWPHRLFPACIPTRCLYRAMRANPILGTFCKSASFHISNATVDPTSEDYVLGEVLLGWLPNVTSLSLHGGINRLYTLPLLKRAFRRLTHVKNLTLSSLYLATACDLVQTIQLHSLTICGISAREDHATWAPISKELERSSSLTSLDLSDFEETPEALQNFLKLPKALEHFRLRGGCSGQASWDLSLFPGLLYDHQTSLKSIEIGELGRGDKYINLLDFPNLETLKLSRYVFDLTPEAACATFLAPKLHTFIWDFTVLDQSSESWTDFGQKQKEWISKFAELAIAQKSMLRKIEIIFTPDQWSRPKTREQLRDWGWPWDLMDEVRDAIKPDIQLSYNKCWEKQEILGRIEEEEQRERETKKKLDGNKDIRNAW